MVRDAFRPRKTELDATPKNSENQFHPCFSESNAIRRAETERQAEKSGDASLGPAVTWDNVAEFFWIVLDRLRAVATMPTCQTQQREWRTKTAGVMTMDIQRLRNLTTGRLHAPLGTIYDDLREITGFSFCTHELGNACIAVKPYLERFAADPRFWNGEYDPAHVGEIDIPPMDEAEREAFSERMSSLPSLLEGKSVIGVMLGSDGR